MFSLCALTSIFFGFVHILASFFDSSTLYVVYLFIFILFCSPPDVGSKRVHNGDEHTVVKKPRRSSLGFFHLFSHLFCLQPLVIAPLRTCFSNEDSIGKAGALD